MAYKGNGIFYRDQILDIRHHLRKVIEDKKALGYDRMTLGTPCQLLQYIVLGVVEASIDS